MLERPKKLAIMQPYFFPYLGYFQLISAVDVYVLYDNLAYIKEGWVNRNRIKQKRKPWFYIRVPVHASTGTMIRDTKMLFDSIKKNKFFKTIVQCYGGSPYFEETYHLLQNALSCEVETIAKLNIFSIQVLCKYLAIDTQIMADSSIFQAIEDKLSADYRDDSETMEETIPKKVSRPILFCQALQSQHFINAIGGINLYSKEVFREHDITLNFLQTLPYSYPQGGISFEPDLSIIDVLMNCGKLKTQQLLQNYTLI